MKLLTSIRGVQEELQIDQKAWTIPIQGSKNQLAKEQQELK